MDQNLKHNAEYQRKIFRDRIVKEGMELWKRQQEHARVKKLQEQQEIREMLEKYWPFGRTFDKPRGLRNLRLEGLFPYKDFQNAKRFVGTMDLGRGGGGAPIMSGTGRRMTRTHEDPMLRFQFGSKDLRRVVDNTLRYKTNKQEQEDYKKQLDKMVKEKKLKAEKEKHDALEFERKQLLRTPPWGRPGPGGRPWRHHYTIGTNFFKSLGWSNEETLKKLENEKAGDNYKKNKMTKLNQIEPLNYIPNKPDFTRIQNKKLAALQESKENGTELVPLIAKQRRNFIRIPLTSTDVTLHGKLYNSTIWNRSGSAYLRDLTQQMNCRRKDLQVQKIDDMEKVTRHYLTLDNFWGKPGHGAANSVIRKQRLDYLLYPQIFPISVH